jgi:tRNA threonylcarbamoyladenosine biosynthesis protein TsaB
VRVLGIETSSVRGSVALIDDERTVCTMGHERENAHGESILPLIAQALATAGWSRRQLDRVAVGLGPGSFTGLRVGIAIAQGLAEGLEIPLVGIPSLRAMAAAVPRDRHGCRCVLLDARRGELFVAAYDADGREALEVRVVSGALELDRLVQQLGDPILLGNGLADGHAPLPDSPNVFRSPETDYPHARWTALLGLATDPSPVLRALYVRDAVAQIPKLPDNPLLPPRPGS